MSGSRHFIIPAFSAAALAVGLSQGAQAASPLASTSFELGRAASGESCRAESAWDDPVTKAHHFDRGFEVQCRGWTDTQSVGHIYVIAKTPAAQAMLATARAARLNCGPAVALVIHGAGPGQAARCSDREGNFPALAVTVVRGASIYAVDGLERFSGNLAAGLRTVMHQTSAAGSRTREPAFALEAVPEPPKGGSLAGADAGILADRWREAVGYSVRGQNVEAREIVARSEGRLPPGATTAERAALKLEAALSVSNLGNYEAAQAQLDQAAALLSDARPTNNFLRAKLKVYGAMVALNRGDYASALTSAASGYTAAAALAEASETDVTGGDNPLRSPSVLRELNTDSGHQRAGDQRSEMLRAEAQYVRGAALRQTGKLREAEVALQLAETSVGNIERARVDTSNLQWLHSQIAVEQARLLSAPGKPDATRTAAITAKYREAVDRLVRSGAYAGSPLLAQRKLAYAAFMADHGDRLGALHQYDDAVAIMRGAGQSAATNGELLERYFKLLTVEAAGDAPAAADARAKFFLASQLVNPPLIAAQIAQIQKIFEAGGSQGAVLAKTLQDLDREGRTLQALSGALKSDATRERDRLAVAIKANDERLAEVRGQLNKDQKYLQVNDSPVTLAELQAALKPGEAYLKIVTLPLATYGLVATHDRVAVYPVAMATGSLAELEKSVRRSIDGSKSEITQRTRVGLFDVEKANTLYALLLDPASYLLKDVTTLIAEPTGGLNELPLGVLVTDRASVDRWNVTVKHNSKDYTGVAFLAKAYDLNTSVSPRAFLIARSQLPSRAALPYIGFGNHAQATKAELATLGTRGLLGQRCAAHADNLRAGYASEISIGAKELAAAAAQSGPGSEVVEGQRFTDTALTSAPPGTYTRFAVVHFATHGLKEGDYGCDSPPGLLTSIAPDGDSDGLLSFEKIANMQFDANLIVLSACNTAAQANGLSGGFRSGAAGQSAVFNGLVRAFLTAGSRAVLTTHWAIPDALPASNGEVLNPSTLLITKLFETGKTATIAEALRHAQTDRMAQWETSHPYYWGAFAIVGDGEKHMFARAS